MQLLFQWITIWLMLAAPVWPISMLCINRSIIKWFKSWFITWLWAATADCLYWSFAVLWLSALVSLFFKAQFFIQSVWVAYLVFIGIKTFFKKPHLFKKEDNSSRTLLKEYVSTFLLTMSNPMTILTFIAIFASLGINYAENSISSQLIVIFWVFVGSAVWWLFLSFIMSRVHSKVNKKAYIIINKASGLAIICLAIYVLYSMTNFMTWS